MSRPSAFMNVLRAVGEAVDLLSDLGEEGIEVARKIEVHAGGGVRMAGGLAPGVADAAPLRRPRVTNRRAAPGPPADGYREPIVDVFDEQDHLHVVAELPGVEAEDVQFRIEGSLLTLEALRGERRYVTAVDLPSPVVEERATSSCRNGVFELKLPKA